MQKLGKGAAAHKVSLVGVLAGTLLLAGAHTASAQTPAPTGNQDNAPSEAARRAAASPYRFILQNAAPRKAAPAPAAAPTPVVEQRRAPAPAPVQQAAAQPSATQASRPAPAPEPEVIAPPPAPAPEPAVAAVSRKIAEPPPPRREIIPIQTDEPKLPPALLREQPKGVVKVHFDIQPNGSVSDVRVLTSTNRALNRPTIDAVQGWKFQPVDEVLTVETELVYKFD
jgi:TonB family protein